MTMTEADAEMWAQQAGAPTDPFGWRHPITGDGR
jgi:hypothetical protein